MTGAGMGPFDDWRVVSGNNSRAHRCSSSAVKFAAAAPKDCTALRYAPLCASLRARAPGRGKDETCLRLSAVFFACTSNRTSKSAKEPASHKAKRTPNSAEVLQPLGTGASSNLLRACSKSAAELSPTLLPSTHAAVITQSRCRYAPGTWTKVCGLNLRTRARKSGGKSWAGHGGGSGSAGAAGISFTTTSSCVGASALDELVGTVSPSASARAGALRRHLRHRGTSRSRSAPQPGVEHMPRFKPAKEARASGPMASPPCAVATCASSMRNSPLVEYGRQSGHCHRRADVCSTRGRTRRSCAAPS